MCRPDYWNDKNTGSKIGVNRLLITKKEIGELNEECLAAADANLDRTRSVNITVPG